MQQARGFTLLEMMVAMGILAIVLAMAVPAFQGFIAGSNVASESNALLTDVQFARSEAVKQGLDVLVCPSSDGASCSATGNWAAGWIVKTDPDNSCADGSASQPGVVLRKQAAFTNGDATSYQDKSGNALTGAFCFKRLGNIAPANTGMVIFDPSSATTYPTRRRCLALGAVGHPQILSPGQTDATTAFTCSCIANFQGSCP